MYRPSDMTLWCSSTRLYGAERKVNSAVQSSFSSGASPRANASSVAAAWLPCGESAFQSFDESTLSPNLSRYHRVRLILFSEICQVAFDCGFVPGERRRHDALRQVGKCPRSPAPPGDMITIGTTFSPLRTCRRLRWAAHSSWMLSTLLSLSAWGASSSVPSSAWPMGSPTKCSARTQASTNSPPPLRPVSRASLQKKKGRLKAHRRRHVM